MANEKEEKKKIKRSTALKRDIQNAERQKRRGSFKSKVRTAISNFKTAPSEDALKHLQSLLDKGVKKRIYKTNTAARAKSRFSKKLTS